ADSNLTTLLELAYHPHLEGKHGYNGKGSLKDGSYGEDLYIRVPCGTIVRRSGRVVADLIEPGQSWLAAKGGRGGRGNASFKTQLNTAPQISEKGEPGESLELDLELKILADAGFVGFPNAGKSTLLAALSAARPKIADYPFTTLNPNLGIVYHKKRSFAAADIPGLIEGAHEGKGLGHNFLKHIERTRVIVHLVDPLGFKDIEPAESVRVIASELGNFSSKLARKPRIIAVNKCDLPQAQEVYRAVRKAFRTRKVFLISAATRQGLDALLDEILRLLDIVPAVRIKPGDDRPEIARHAVEPLFTLERDETGLVVVGGATIERKVQMTNFGQPESVIRLRKYFKTVGLDKALANKGIHEGDSVVIAGREFEWSYSPGSDMAERAVSRRKRA
ncbi:MAG: GTPase ObgE, partial [Elusimicrobiaceae bacterium]|nr:GTPase ObgE [Elusimicrobiaceae bacterium]